MNVTIICDASYDSMTKTAGYGYWIACERGKYGGGGSMTWDVKDATIAELMAIANSLVEARNRKLLLPKDKVLLQTDCQAAIMVLERTRKCRWGQEAVVVEYITKFIEGHSVVVKYRHIKGHTMNKAARYVTNRMCDLRARRAMRVARTRKTALTAISKIREVLNEQ